MCRVSDNQDQSQDHISPTAKLLAPLAEKNNNMTGLEGRKKV